MFAGMSFAEYNLSRVRNCNQHPIHEDRDYILYWMQAYRRLERNHALDYANHLGKKYGKPVLIYEGLRMDYPWSSERIHRFVLEGMCFNGEIARKRGWTYYAFVETNSNPGKGLLKKLSEAACLVVTDDFPAFIIPEQTNALAKKADCRVLSVDSNGIIPLSVYGSVAGYARVIRPRMHREFESGFLHPSQKRPKPNTHKWEGGVPFAEFSGRVSDIEPLLSQISFLEEVPSVRGVPGGRGAALDILEQFVLEKLSGYSDRSRPASPKDSLTSGLSAYLHFGYISVDEIVERLLDEAFQGNWTPDELHPESAGKRDGFFGSDPNVNGFLDELLTWRDLGYLWFWHSPSRSKDLEELPDWVEKNFEKHRDDPRDFTYTLEEFENSRTHDPIWNAAQKELKLTGRMHNYLRMLWGKKVIEWTRDYEEAFAILEHLNNKYAYDGRNPNSYTGILWCFGMFDRPWGPERNVFGNVRYMSSDSTKKKFKIQPYLDYVESLEGKDGLFSI